MKKLMLSVITILITTAALAGGDPEFVPFPANYKKTDTNYATLDRNNGKQVAVLYANEPAMKSVQYGDELVPGSRIIMEIYKFKKDADGKAIMGTNGVHEKGDLAAVAVMEKSIEWSEKYSLDHRADEWGFAIYTPDGQPKKNDLDCASCHIPLDNQDELFTHAQLKATVK
ncbi:MAG: cytochrome P460 family protein [Gammaproteobacteria bacterium]